MKKIASQNKIIVCDDDSSILEMMELLLSLEGYKVISVISSPDLLSIIEDEKPCLVILDLWMPVLPGEEVLKLLQTNEAVSQIPVIVFSAGPEGEKVAMQTGAKRFFAKPFDHKELMEAVGAFCKPVLQHELAS